MHHRSLVSSTRARSTVRTLSQHEELPLLRDHLLRLDRAGRHDRFNGFIDDSFIEGTPKNAPTTARSLSPTSRTAW